MHHWDISECFNYNVIVDNYKRLYGYALNNFIDSNAANMRKRKRKRYKVDIERIYETFKSSYDQVEKKYIPMNLNDIHLKTGIPKHTISQALLKLSKLNKLIREGSRKKYRYYINKNNIGPLFQKKKKKKKLKLL